MTFPHQRVSLSVCLSACWSRCCGCGCCCCCHQAASDFNDARHAIKRPTDAHSRLDLLTRQLLTRLDSTYVCINDRPSVRPSVIHPHPHTSAVHTVHRYTRNQRVSSEFNSMKVVTRLTPLTPRTVYVAEIPRQQFPRNFLVENITRGC